MKAALLLSASLICYSVSYSQTETVQMGDNFNDASKLGSRASGFEGFQTYHSGNIEGSQFFTPGWSTGTVTTITNQQFGKNYRFLYDKVRQELFFKWKDSSVVLLADKNQIASFTLNSDRVHSFVDAGAIDPSNKGNFFEVLVKDEKGYSLYKLIKTKFVKADERDMEKQATGDVFDSFQDQITYYLLKDGVLQTVALRKNNILKTMAPVKEKLTAYFDHHSDVPLDEGFLIGAVLYING